MRLQDPRKTLTDDGRRLQAITNVLSVRGLNAVEKCLLIYTFLATDILPMGSEEGSFVNLEEAATELHLPLEALNAAAIRLSTIKNPILQCE